MRVAVLRYVCVLLTTLLCQWLAGAGAKVAFCEAMGAVRALNYKEEDWDAEVRAHGDGGVDLVLDMVGGPYFQSNLSVLRDRGR